MSFLCHLAQKHMGAVCLLEEQLLTNLSSAQFFDNRPDIPISLGTFFSLLHLHLSDAQIASQRLAQYHEICNRILELINAMLITLGEHQDVASQVVICVFIS